ncbi:MAG TPA: DoxX family protein [Pedobacter sp.]|uniref:DoxX family protein n=1 Tax=Pedobacter sp. TaxID=1411316 RepID=UPI002BEF3290|nr:DoxX family protein [Pedobacter sp.]HMI01391.1 DoxX family protein [Pedobacter sp.]
MLNKNTKKLPASDNYAPLILRLTLGLILWPHGAQKLLGSFNGHGFERTMHYFTETVHLPALIGFLVIMMEFFGSIAIVLGLATRILSGVTILLFTGITITHHWHAGFFMDWFGTNPPGFEGFEFDLLMMGMALSLVISGGGKYAADHFFGKRNTKSTL